MTSFKDDRPRRRNRVGLVVTAFALLVTLLSLPAAAQEETYTFDGGGWGHGVGMSQFGAYGMALEDPTVTADDILTHYYTGVEIGDVSSATVEPFLLEEELPLWIGIFQDEETVTFTTGPTVSEPGASAILCYGGEEEPSCDIIAQPGDLWRYEVLADGCQFSKKVDGVWTPQTETKTVECGASATPATPDTIIMLTALKTPLQLKSGALRIREDVPTPSDPDGGLHAIWQSSLEDYVRGIAEMPDSWGDVAPAAIEAQAIAARTYAANRVGDRGSESGFTVTRRGLCWCNLFDDTRDQVFTGWTGELAHPNAALAASETTGKVLLHEGSTIQAYYFSSSFGFTENSEDVFTQALPYLRSVEDPWSLTSPGNPFDVWDPPPTFTATDLAARLGWQKVEDVRIVSSAPAARVYISGLGSGGAPIQKEFRGEDLRTPLGLRSPQITAINGVGTIAGVPNFTDIEGSVHGADIIQLAKLGITKGCNPPDNDRFCPDDPVTRGQMAAFLHRALGGLLVPGESVEFVDDDGSIFEADIEWLGATGVTKGCNPPDNDRFCPDAGVTRAQMASFLVRALVSIEG